MQFRHQTFNFHSCHRTSKSFLTCSVLLKSSTELPEEAFQFKHTVRRNRTNVIQIFLTCFFGDVGRWWMTVAAVGSSQVWLCLGLTVCHCMHTQQSPSQDKRRSRKRMNKSAIRSSLIELSNVSVETERMMNRFRICRHSVIGAVHYQQNELLWL